MNPRTRTLPCFRLLATTIAVRLNCAQTQNTEWFERHTALIRLIEREILPSGSGIDSGTAVDLDRSTADRIVLHTSYHHMNDGGMYDGWTEHTITVRGSLLSDFELTISGRNRNDIKPYLVDVFSEVLSARVTETYDPTTEQTTLSREV